MVRRNIRRLLAFDVANRAEDALRNGRPEREQRPAGSVGIDPVNVNVLPVIPAGHMNRALAVVVVRLRQLLRESSA